MQWGGQIFQRVGGQVAVAHHHRRGVQKVHPLGHEVRVDGREHAHVAHGHQHVALRVHDGDIAGGGVALAHQQPPGAHAQLSAGIQQHAAVDVVAHGAHQFAPLAQAGEIVQNVAGHAAHRHVQPAGVGIPHDEGGKALAVDVHIGSADARHIALAQENTSRKNIHLENIILLHLPPGLQGDTCKICRPDPASGGRQIAAADE